MPKKGKKEVPKTGTLFPVDKNGVRSTTHTGKQVLAAALRGAGAEYAAANVEKLGSKKWRFGYNKAYMSLVKESCKSPEAALGSAKAGLEWMYDNFEHAKSEAEPPVKFSKMVKAEKRSFKTGVVKGKKKGSGEYEVPYDGGWAPSFPKPPTKSLSGPALKTVADTWVKKGVVEQDAAEAIGWTADYFSEGKDLSDCHFVLIGAGSAMGPFPKLLSHGANVVAIDIPGAWFKDSPRPASGLWDRLFKTAEESSGTLTYPMNPDAPAGTPENEAAGCDLTAEPARIANWLVQWQKSLPKHAKVVVGNYTYLDSDLHVKLALCADVCIDALIQGAKADKRSPPTVAFLCTPTDIHVVPKPVSLAATRNGSFWHPGWLLFKVIRLLTFGAKLVPNGLKPVPTSKGKDPLYVCDGLSVAQGPNYALAKRMQHWRAMIAYDGGATVSSMVAPSTATLSVIHNKTFAWAYGGLPFFKFEIFKEDTTKAIMAAVMIRDVLDENSPKNPKNRPAGSNTLELFKTESVHGGLWRSGYKLDTLGEISAFIYFAGGPKLFGAVIVLIYAAVAMCVYKAVMPFL